MRIHEDTILVTYYRLKRSFERLQGSAFPAEEDAVGSGGAQVHLLMGRWQSWFLLVR